MGSATSLDGEGCRPRGTDWIASGASNVSPESGGSGYENNLPERIIQATWMWPATNRLLMDAGVSVYTARWGGNAPPGGLTHLTPVTEITTVGTGVPVPNFTYRGLDNYFDNSHSPTHWRASVAYVTGAHNMKVGYQGHYHIEKTYDFANDTQLTYSFTGGTPTSFGFRIAPWQTSNRTVSHAMFAQDQWTVGRITLQGAVRYDHAHSFFLPPRTVHRFRRGSMRRRSIRFKCSRPVPIGSMASRAITMSRRVWAPPGICSAPDEPRCA
jgi:hypothetical protein